MTGAGPRRRVLHLLGSTSFSGAENVIITMMEMFRDSELEMVYCSPEGPIRDAVESRGLAFLPLPGLTPRGVRSVLRDGSFDVLHAHDFKASVVAAGARFPGPTVSHIHSNAGFTKSWNPYSAAYAVAARTFHRIVFVSQEAVRGTVFAEAVADRTRILTNVIDRGRVERLAAQEDVSPTDVVYLGRLVGVKRPQQVVQAVALARTELPGLTLRMVGDGDLRGACEAEIARTGLGGAVILEGFRANPYPFVRAARLALMPSEHEGLGLAALECLALGVPVLNSGAGGLGDMFRGHPEFICADVEEYAAQIVALADPARYRALQEVCAEIVEPFADLERYREQVRELYAD